MEFYDNFKNIAGSGLINLKESAWLLDFSIRESNKYYLNYSKSDFVKTREYFDDK